MSVARGPQPLPTPCTDAALLTDSFGRAWGVTQGKSIPQYLAWSERAGIFDLLKDGKQVTKEECAQLTALSAEGASALIPILVNIGAIEAAPESAYRLSPGGLEYLVKESPYYIGGALYWDCQEALPQNYLKSVPEEPIEHAAEWSIDLRLSIPYSRNLSASVVAARTGEFDGRTHIVDVGGGAGAFAVPLVQDHACLRITLVDQRAVIGDVRAALAARGVHERIAFVGMDALAERWDFGPCDGVVMGNIFHGVDDDACLRLARKAFAALSAGGKIWLHELLFDPNREGPLIAALWNANMIARKRGARQRTAAELIGILAQARFEECYVRPTASHFSLVIGCKT